MQANKVRKIRVDTVAGAVATFQEASKADPLSWPSDVNLPADQEEQTKALAIFSEVQAGRARAHWKPHHARMVAEYSLLTGQIDLLMARILATGPTIITAKGHEARNPLLDAMSMFTAQRNQLIKSLGLAGARAETDNSAKSELAVKEGPLTNSIDDLIG